MKRIKVDDDFTKRTGYIDDFLVSELFVTRLGCEAFINMSKTKRDATIKKSIEMLGKHVSMFTMPGESLMVCTSLVLTVKKPT